MAAMVSLSNETSRPPRKTKTTKKTKVARETSISRRRTGLAVLTVVRSGSRISILRAACVCSILLLQERIADCWTRPDTTD